MPLLIDRIIQGTISKEELTEAQNNAFFEFFKQFKLLNAERRYECVNHEKVREFLELM